MKKILFVLPSMAMGGLEKSLIAIVNVLVKVGYDITVLTWKPRFDLKDELDERVRFVYRLHNSHIGKRIPYIRYKLFDDDMWLRRASPKQLSRFYLQNKKYDVEIAFLHDTNTVNIISGSQNKQAVKLAWIHFDFLQDARIQKGIKDGTRSREELEKTFSAFNYIICASHQVEESFKATVGDTGNIVTIYNLLPLREIAEKAKLSPEVDVPKAAFHIVIVARLVDSIKGQLRAIRAVARLRDEGADISLALVGGGADKDMLAEEIRTLGAEGYITLTGKQFNPYPFIKEADLLVCSSYTEGYNLTVAEALIIGTPVLSTECTGPNEILDNGRYGMMVENSDEGLYEGIKTLYDNPKLWEAYRKATAERLPFFSNKNIIEHITQLFRSDEEEPQT